MSLFLETEINYTTTGEDDLADSIRELTDVAAKWRNIGIQLGIRDSQLEAMQGDSPLDCLRQMLSTWLRKNYNVKQFGEPTWAKLVEVIDHSAGGGNPSLAMEIAKKHGGTCKSKPSWYNNGMLSSSYLNRTLITKSSGR